MPVPVKVLLLEDNAADAKLALHALGEAGYAPEAHRVDREADFLAALDSSVELILVDYRLPDWDGLAALAAVQRSGLDIPVIMVTGAIGDELAAAAIRQGAADYLLKDRLARLGPAVVRALEQRELRRARQRAEAEFAASEQRYRRLFESAQDGILLLNAETGRVVDANPFLTDLLGIPRDDLLGRKAWELGCFGAIVGSRESFEELRRKETVRSDDKPLRAADGRIVDVEFVGTRYLEAGHPVIQCHFRDITERRTHEQEIARLGRIYHVLSQINRAIVRADAREELFAEVCRVIVATGGFRLAWVGWIDPATRRLEPAASAGDEGGFVAGLGISADGALPEGRGPTGTAFREDRVYVCQRLRDDPATLPWREAMARSGMLASIALPLHFDGAAAGVLSVYAAEENVFGPREIALLEEVARDVSFALTVIADRARRRAAETALQASLAFNVGVLDSIVDHIAVLDAQGVILAVNATWRAFAEQNGAPQFGSRAVGGNYLAACDAAARSPEAADALSAGAGIRAVLAGEKPEFTLDYPCHSPTERRWFQMRVTPLVGPRPGVVVAHKNITADRLAQQHLRKLSRIVEQAPVSVVITDLGGRIEYVNPRFCAVSGYAPEEIVGRNPRMLQSGKTPVETYRALWGTLARGEVWSGEFENRRKDGTAHVESAVIAPVLDETGRATHYVALKEDITERRRAALALRDAQLRYRLIAENSEAVIWLYDPAKDSFGYCSPSVRKLRGYTAEEVLGQKLAAVLAPSAADFLRRTLPERLAAFAAGDLGQRTRRDEVEQTRRDGTVVPTELETTLLADGAGGVSQILGVSRDITERVQAREALRRFNAGLERTVAERTAELAASNRRLQGLLASIPDTVLRLRADGTVLHVQAAPDFPAVPGRAEPVGPELVAPSLELGRNALARSAIVTGETVLAAAAGEVALELRAAPSGADEFVVFARDITARKRLEVQMAATLEKEQQISGMKTRFISMISHEFRTPMAAAQGSAELLHHHFDQLAPEKREQLFGRITASFLRLTTMLDEVMLISRVDSGRIDRQTVPLDLRQTLQNLIDEARLADSDAHPIRLAPAESAPVPMVSAPTLLQHIFSNLISNALRYSAAGKPVTVTIAENGDAITVAIRDEGIGIPRADLARIGQPFERGSNVGNIRGTGLGLSIVKRLVDLLGGTFAVESTEGQGSCFSLVLPRHVPPPSAPDG